MIEIEKIHEDYNATTLETLMSSWVHAFLVNNTSKKNSNNDNNQSCCCDELDGYSVPLGHDEK
jgi:hypothetical protein